MNALALGFDDNLGLPSNFSQHTGLKLNAYHELEEMISDFEAKKLALMFIPCGVLPYLNEPYSIVAQATLGPKHEQCLHVKLVTSENTSLQEVLEKEKTFGRINPYCTTSYWGLMIFLMNQFPSGNTIHFLGVNGFQDLFEKTINGQAQCSMLWDKVLEQNASRSSSFHIIGDQKDLPTPIIVSNNSFERNLEQILNRFEFNEKNGFFNGFKKPNLKHIHDFQGQMQKAATYFHIKMA